MNYDYSCNRCEFSIKKLVEMSEVAGNKEIFNTFGGLRKINIYEVDLNAGEIYVKRSTGEITQHGLAIEKLIKVHEMVHAGEVELDPDDIDYLEVGGKKYVFLWGKYIAALLKHLKCKQCGDVVS